MVAHSSSSCKIAPTRHDLARVEGMNLEMVVGRFGHRLGEGFRRAVDGVERLREARGHLSAGMDWAMAGMATAVAAAARPAAYRN